MPRKAALTLSPLDSLLLRVPKYWHVPLFQVIVASIGLIAWFGGDWADMADQWWNSSTYNHILLVPPIVGWLVWQRKDELVKLVPCAWWPGLLIVTGALLLWLLGALSGLNLARQLGAVAVLQGVVITLLGPRVSAGLTFPLAYMLFLVPFGEELVPMLQMVTAKLTISLTHLSGVPAVIDGVFIDTPVGLFEVAEACSGVKFLIAMVSLATLVAQVCFKSWPRRIAFMAVAVVLPVLANGVRAWGTIYIAQSQGVEFAEGFDHIFYGWIFFALVMAVLLGGAWRFFDRDVDDKMIDTGVIMRSGLIARVSQLSMKGWAGFAAIAVLALTAGIWSDRANTLSAELPQQIQLPNVTGWELTEYSPHVWWEPRAEGAEHRLLGHYRSVDGLEVDVFFALYSAQGEGREAGGFGQGALMPDSDWRWLEAGPALADAKSDWLFANGHVKRLAATFYRTGDILTGSNSRLKLANMSDRVLMRPEATMVLILTAVDSTDHPASDTILAFRDAIGVPGAWMDGIAQLP